MASHSMAAAQPCSSYGVFLSFRGEDTRDGFTDHLYTALTQSGIRTFRDDATERGKLLKPELKKAIHNAAISLIVFSKNYASSKWCLDEVLMIIEEHKTSTCKHEVIPVFYKTDPSDVRNQTGSFKEAFDAYDDEIKAETDLEKKKELLEKVGAWRYSLKEAANFTGMVFKDGYESKFIINIVNVVRKKLDYKSLYIEEKLVGIENGVAEIESWLQDPSPDAVVLVIDGMGGIGKSTIAKCIFNLNSRNYDASCFLADINETSDQPGGLLRLQSQLLSNILKSEKEEMIWNIHEGTNKIENAIHMKKVLVILDDVATLKQLDVLLGPKRFAPGSKVMITTRHKWLSTAFTVHPKVHSVKTLSTDDAVELFSFYAFHQDQSNQLYIFKSDPFVRYCTGLPLALKVLGSSLRGKTNDEWEDTMHKLAAIPHPGVQNVLKISYETLEDDTVKDLFLHIACFFEGEEKDYIVKLLDQCDLYPVGGIKNLMDRCLLYIEDERVMMHQLIKEMGRGVVRQESPKNPGKRSRLWHHDDCFNVLQSHSGTNKVEGFMLDMQKIKETKSTHGFEAYLGKRMHGNDANFKIGALEKMKNLMLLQLNYVTFSGRYKKLPKKLRWLSWHGFSLKAIPCDISLEKLVVLDMSYSKLKRVWDGYKFIGSLKILKLSYSVELIETPDFSGLPGLESLILKGCSGLIRVGESISYLKELVLLDLTNCRSLREFPCLPTSIVSLQMSGCPFLGVLGCIQSFGSRPSASFSFLTKANFSFCNLFDNSFPNDWSGLVSLKDLNISGNYVTSLPNCIQTLPTIQKLSVERCSKIQSILGLPEFVHTLYANYNKSLEKVQPAKTSMTAVYQHNCPKLCEVEGRYKLQSLDKVDRKIVRCLGLEESNAGERTDLCLQVLHEFGIFSTYVPEKQIPSFFMYKKKGKQISFKVPWHQNSWTIIGFNMCVVFYYLNKCHPFLEIEVYNKTEHVWWTYQKKNQEIPRTVEKLAWLSFWRCGNLLEAGDEIFIRVIMGPGVVEECCINLIYEGNDEQQLLDEETKKVHLVNASDQMLWTDRMNRDISNFVFRGKRLDGETKQVHLVNASDHMLWTDKMNRDVPNFVFRGKRFDFFNNKWPL